MASTFQKYANALRLPYVSVSFLPALIAGILAFKAGFFDPVSLIVSICAVVLAHMGANLSNDYYDFLAGNYGKKKIGPSGGSFSIQKGDFKKDEILKMAFTCFILSLVLFAFLSLRHIIVFVLGFLGILICYYYTAHPIRLGYRGFGELATFIGMGPLLFETVFYAQTGFFSVNGFLLSIFLGTLTLNVLLAAQAPDIEIDRRSGKLTLASTFGPEALAKVYLLSAIIGTLALLVSVIHFGLPLISLAGLFGLYFSVKSYFLIKSDSYVESVLGSINAMQLSSLLIILGLILF